MFVYSVFVIKDFMMYTHTIIIVDSYIKILVEQFSKKLEETFHSPRQSLMELVPERTKEHFTLNSCQVKVIFMNYTVG